MKRMGKRIIEAQTQKASSLMDEDEQLEVLTELVALTQNQDTFVDIEYLKKHLTEQPPTCGRELTVQDVPKNMVYKVELEHSYLPTILGAAIWERLPWEDPDMYKFFRLYRELGVLRQVHVIAAKFNRPTRELSLYAKLYHWSTRADAWDYYSDRAFKENLPAKQQRVDTIQLQYAEDLFAKCVGYCDENLNKFKPNEILKLMELSASLARTSAGLLVKANQAAGPVVNVNTQNNMVPGQGNPGDPNNPYGTKVEVIVEPPKSDDEIDKEKEKIAGILNVMNQIGVFNQKAAVVEELDADAILVRE